MNRNPKRAAVLAAFVALAVSSLSTPAAAQLATPDSAQVTLQATDLTFDGRLTFNGHGFVPGESCSVTIEDAQGGTQAQLEPARVESDGQIYTVSVPLPAELAPGPHTLHLTGLSSGRSGHAPFSLQWQLPTVHLDAYTGKPTHTLSFGGSGFVPGESVDVYLGTQTTSPLASVTADSLGRISAENVGIPFIGAGDYTVAFVGRVSQTPVSVGFNIQGFHPWVVLTNYYVSQQSGVGFIGQDFVPGETVQVYLNSRMSQPVAQATADADGRFSAESAFSAANVTGDNELIFVGQQSQTEVTLSFAVAPPAAANP
jgi:hypothetical protein